MKRIIIIFLVSVAALCSCRDKREKDTFMMPKFPSHTKVKTRVIVDFLPCNLSYGIWESGGLLCALYFDSETETLVHLFDKQTGQNKGNYVHRGRGPLEMPLSIPCTSARDGVLYMTDIVKCVMDSSPDCKHLILGSVWGGLLELYSLPDLKHTGFLRLADPTVILRRSVSRKHQIYYMV